MEMADKIKICSTCKNREFNPECGTVCSFTKDKPSFEEVCDKYAADETQLSKEASKAEALEEEKSISGWLAFFLWVGVGLGALISVIMGLAQTFGQGFGWFFTSTYLIMMGSLLVTAILTIIAFYKRNSNAVALATTYIAMIVLDGVMSLVIAAVSEDSSMYPQAFRQLCWGAIWFSYLRQSSKVELIVPILTRTWNKLEKFILALYILSLSIFTLSIVYVHQSENPQNIFFTDSSYINQNIAEANKELPINIADGIVLQRINKEQNAVVYIYQFSNVYLSETGTDYWTENASVNRHEMLYELYKDPNSDAFLTTCFKEGYNVIYRYNDAVSETLYTVTITPDDYKKALEGKSYKCPISELSDLVYKYNLQLPTDYMGDASLRRIYLAKNDSELVYVVRLPQMSLDDMSSITTSYLKEYVSSNWSDLYDSMIRLAVVNQMDICFEFNTYSGIEYAKIRMTPEIYNKME